MSKIFELFKERNIYGKLMMLVGVILCVPILVVPFYPHEAKYITSFLLTGLGSVLLGILVCIVKRPPKDNWNRNFWQSSMQQGSVPVLFAWCYGILMGAVPFVMGRQLSPMHALFESASGWTTTGLSVADVTRLPRIFLFHRSFMQYCGGLGFILMILLLVGGKQAVNLFNAEGHTDRLMPNIKETVRTIFIIYNIFVLGGTLLYVIFGMPVFDALCHTMSALSTAGFTTQPQSIGTYHSFAIEAVTVLLMLIGATNFAALLLIVRFRWIKLLKISELRFMLVMICVLTPTIGISLMRCYGWGIFRSLHEALFGIVTTFTTTGYSISDYAHWPAFPLGILVVLMVVGGGVGSTAGGIKLSRTYLLLRIAWINTRKRLTPSRSVKVENYYRAQGKTPIDAPVVSDVFGFTAVYVIVMIAGTLLITLTENCPLFDAFFEFTSALGTVGISNGLTSPNAHNSTLIIEIVGMLLGRLEIFIVFIGIYTGVNKVGRIINGKRVKE